MPVSRTSKFLQGAGVTVFASIASFIVWTKHVHWEDISSATDPLFHSEIHKKYNPSLNQLMHDVCVRKIPAFKLKPELIQDAQDGGTKLVEEYCAGIWGGFGYLIQRLYLAQRYKNTATAHQLWSKKDIENSTYDKGTEITDHFIVLSKSTSVAASPKGNDIVPSPWPKANVPAPASSPIISQTILLRGGDSPRNSPHSPREIDGLIELASVLNLEKGYVEFRIKSIFFQGIPKPDPKDRPRGQDLIAWLHRRYSELLIEGATRNCLR